MKYQWHAEDIGWPLKKSGKNISAINEKRKNNKIVRNVDFSRNVEDNLVPVAKAA